jgi:hypothetical protein
VFGGVERRDRMVGARDYAVRPASVPNRALQEQNGTPVLKDFQRCGAKRQNIRSKHQSLVHSFR